MYRITNDLMGRSSKPLFPKSDDGPGALADCFVTHFTDKITNIRVHLATISTQRQQSVFADDDDCRVVDPLCDFELATGNDICDLVMKGTSKFSSHIDIISATLLKSNIAMLTACLLTNCTKLAHVSTHTAGYSRIFRSERKLLKSITSPQEVLVYALVYRRVACWDPCFLQSTVYGSTMPLNSNSVTTCMRTIPSCLLNIHAISQCMLQLPLTAYRDLPQM